MTTQMKSTPPFDALPDEARVWVFASAEPLEPAARDRLLQTVDRFLEGWHAHGRPVVGSRDLRYDRFLLVAADEAATGVSGCSIDSLFRTLGALERELEVSLLDGSRVWYRDGAGRIRSVDRPTFRARVASGEVGEETVVFDQTVPTVGQVRGGGWERPMAESWHGRAFTR